MTIGACMIVKDEANIIAKTLNDISKCFDEIIVVDTGSSDGTFELLQTLHETLSPKVKVYQFNWCDNFSSAREFSFSKSTTDYVTWWDADDELTLGIATLVDNIRREGVTDQIPCIYKVVTNTKWSSEGLPLGGIVNERIFPRKVYRGWRYPIHEQVQLVRSACNIIEIPLNMAYISHHKDLHNPHHLLFFKRLIAKGYKFYFHDYYYLVNELLNQPDFKEHTERYEEFIRFINGNLPYAMRYLKDEYTGYLAYIYSRFYDEFKPALYDADKFRDLSEQILYFLLSKYQPNSQLCCWFAARMVDIEPIRYWVNLAKTLQGYSPDYTVLDRRWWNDEPDKILHNFQLSHEHND